MACNLVVFLKHCHIYGCFNDLNVPVAGNLVVFSNLAKYLVLGLQFCGIFKHCLVGGFKLKSLNFSPLNIAFLVASIDWIFSVAGNFVVPSKIEIIGWLQQLKLFPVACNLVVFSNIVTYLVSWIIQIFPRGWQSCCIFKYGKILGGFNTLNFPPVASNPVVFSNIARYLVASN